MQTRRQTWKTLSQVKVACPTSRFRFLPTPASRQPPNASTNSLFSREGKMIVLIDNGINLIKMQSNTFCRQYKNALIKGSGVVSFSDGLNPILRLYF